jgi:hypothetical protein
LFRSVLIAVVIGTALVVAALLVNRQRPLVPFLMRIDRTCFVVCAGFMVLQVVVGLLGFYYHTSANLHQHRDSVHQLAEGPRLYETFVSGAPALAAFAPAEHGAADGAGPVVLARHLPGARAA